MDVWGEEGYLRQKRGRKDFMVGGIAGQTMEGVERLKPEWRGSWLSTLAPVVWLLTTTRA